MKTRTLVTLLSPIAVALLAFGSQIALAQETATASRAQVQAEALQAQKSGALERERITSYSANPTWGPGAPANTSPRALAAAQRAVASRPAGTSTAPAAPVKSSSRNPA